MRRGLEGRENVDVGGQVRWEALDGVGGRSSLAQVRSSSFLLLGSVSGMHARWLKCFGVGWVGQ